MINDRFINSLIIIIDQINSLSQTCFVHHFYSLCLGSSKVQHETYGLVKSSHFYFFIQIRNVINLSLWKPIFSKQIAKLLLDTLVSFSFFLNVCERAFSSGRRLLDYLTEKSLMPLAKKKWLLPPFRKPWEYNLKWLEHIHSSGGSGWEWITRRAPLFRTWQEPFKIHLLVFLSEDVTNESHGSHVFLLLCAEAWCLYRAACRNQSLIGLMRFNCGLGYRCQ